MPLGYDVKSYEVPRKPKESHPAEHPAAPAPVEVAPPMPEKIPVPVESPSEEPEKREAPVASEHQAEQQPEPKSEPKPEPTAEPTAETKTEPKAEPKTEPVPVPEPEVGVEPAEITDVPVEDPGQKGSGDLKILGKMDLSSFEKKSFKKGKEKFAPAAQPAAPETHDAAQPKTDGEPAKHTAEAGNLAPVETEKEGLAASLPATEVPAEKMTEQKPEPPVPPVEVKAPPAPVHEFNFLPTERIILEGPTILGSIILPEPRKFEKKKPVPVASSSDTAAKGKKKKRKRIKRQGEEVTPEVKPGSSAQKPPVGKDKKFHKEIVKPEVTQEDIERQIKETLSRLAPTGKSKASKYRKAKREAVNQQMHQEMERMEEGKRIIKVTEFVTANELASMMNVQVTEVISTCMALGMFVSINQRLDAETLSLVAEEFGYKLEFVSVEVQEAIRSHDEDKPEDMRERAPIVTVMGHVDHGKTKLLDFIRSTNVVAGEAGGITQHIGAYEVRLENGKEITFLDTPGHEAFTAMRARGAKVTDVAIIVIAADETVMPQTKEAINHALAAGVPIVFAINKIDKPNSNPEKIREELSKMNILVEEWGGKYQTQEISAKTGLNVGVLLEKVLLESEMLNLKANPTRQAFGTVIESSLDKGRGYVSKLLVQNGTLHIGDIVLAGATYGRVKAMYNERNQPIKEAGPSQPMLMLGLNGAPQAGDGFNVMTDEKEAKAIATKRLQLQREQGLRTQKHITLDEIGRRIAIGDFKELNIIVKGDVDGSVEALSDSLLKLSTEEVMVNVIHKSVGAITESDVLLASASNAVIVGFQVRPSLNARKLAEAEQIDIRLYSIIYQAIEEIRAAIEGMLSPEIEEKILCNIEVRDVFKITKVGSVAGCMVLDGKVTRNTKIRVIRDGIVVHTGSLGSLKRFKDDVKEVVSGYECGLNIDNFNDIKVGDIVEGYEQIEVKRKL